MCDRVLDQLQDRCCSSKHDINEKNCKLAQLLCPLMSCLMIHGSVQEMVHWLRYRLCFFFFHSATQCQWQNSDHWWACLTSTLRNCINRTCLFKFWAYSSTSYYYHSIPTTPLTLQSPIWDKELPKHVQLALCDYDKNSLKELLCSQVGALST